MNRDKHHKSFFEGFKRGIKIGRLKASKPNEEVKPNLADLTIRELALLGSVYKIPYYSRMNKTDLIQELNNRHYPLSPQR